MAGDDSLSQVSGYGDLIYQPKTGLHKALAWAQSFAFFALAIFTIISLLDALSSVTRQDLRFDESPPSDRCVPFFDDIKSFVADNKAVGARALYDYRAGTALARICTNRSAAEVAEKIGKQYIYDPWIADLGCDVLNDATDRKNFITNCEFDEDSYTKPYPSCASVFNITPQPIGFHWAGFVEKLREGSNRTLDNGTIVKRGKCAAHVTTESTIAPCTYAYMGAFKQTNTDIAIVLYLAVAVPFVVMFLQFIAVWVYANSGWASDKGYLLAFANRGPAGGLYSLYWWCKEGEVADNGTRGELPDVYLTFPVWFLTFVQDGLEGVAAPLTAVLGCSLSRFPVPVALIALKIISLLYNFIDYARKRTRESEPGTAEGQEEFAQRELAAFCKLKGKPMPGGKSVPSAPSPQHQATYAPTTYAPTPGYNTVHVGSAPSQFV